MSRAAGELTGEGAEGVETQRERGRGSAGPPVPLYDKDLVRLMAEVNFINGEVSVAPPYETRQSCRVIIFIMLRTLL